MSRMLLILFCFLVSQNGPATACEAEKAQTTARTILGLYDGGRENSPADTRLHRFIELPLNHLGYRVRYLDVSRDDLPQPVDPSIAGAVSWFDAPLPDSERFAAWAVAARSDCPDAISFIVLGETGLFADHKPSAAEADYLHRLGLGWTARSILLGDLTDVSHTGLPLRGFESDFVFRPGRYASLRALTATDAALSVVPAGKQAGDSIDLIVQHHPNAYVHQSATLDADSRAEGYFWIMDPFAILGAALARDKQTPIADVTTLNGRRIYFETVGPEGWLAPAPARTFDEEPRLGAESLAETLIMPFPDLPVTVSVVTGDLDETIGGKSAQIGRRMAVSILTLPQTAVATSGRSLVRHWAAISKPPQTAATPFVKDTVSLDQPNRLLAVLGRNLRQAFADPYAPDEPQLSDGLRQYGQDPFVTGAETSDAIETVRTLIPNKHVRPLFLWSGDGRPAQDAQAAVRQAGAAAFGGGITKVGASLSMSALSSFFLSDGQQIQVYHALPGDLGNLGYPLKDVHALQGLGLMVLQTDHPMRLKPFQLAYSAGTANQFATRSIIERLKHLAVSTGTIPIFAARYVEIVEGFSSVEFNPDGALKWRVTGRGGLQTLRFDDAQALSVDLAESAGVLGARRINRSLYIALDPGIVEPVVALTPDASPSGMKVLAGRIGLLDSNLEILSATRTPCLSVLEVTGWGMGEISFYGDPGAGYLVNIVAGARQSAGLVLGHIKVVADASGYVAVTVPTRHGKVETVSLHQQCPG